MISRISKPLLAFLLFSCTLTQATAATSTSTAPDFTLPTAHGTLALADLKGKVVYLDFWASWCPPCRKSFPWMNEMQHRYSRQGLTVVAVNLDKDRTLADKFLHETPANFTVAYDQKGKVAEAYHVPGMPSSFIIDRSGKIQSVHIGFREDESSALEETLRTALRH